MKKSHVAIAIELTVLAVLFALAQIPALAADAEKGGGAVNITEICKDAVATIDVAFHFGNETKPKYRFPVPVVNRQYDAVFENIEAGSYTVNVCAMDKLSRPLFNGQAPLTVLAGQVNAVAVAMKLVGLFQYDFAISGMPIDLQSNQPNMIYVEDASGNLYYCSWRFEGEQTVIYAWLPLDFTGGVVHIIIGQTDYPCVIGLDIQSALTGVVTLPYVEPVNLGDVDMDLVFPGDGECFEAQGDPVRMGKICGGAVYMFDISGDYAYVSGNNVIDIYCLAPDPTAAVKVGTINSWSPIIAAGDGILATTLNGTVKLYDVSRPDSPISVLSIKLIHDCGQLDIKDRKLYAWSWVGLSVFDLSQFPQVSTLTELKGQEYLRNLYQVVPNGNALYLLRGNAMSVLDVSDYSAPQEAQTIIGSFNRGTVNNNRLAIVSSTDTCLYDVTDPLNPVWMNMYGVVPNVYDVDIACGYVVRTAYQQITVNTLESGDLIGVLTSNYGEFGHTTLYKHYALSQDSGASINVLNLAATGTEPTVQ